MAQDQTPAPGGGTVGKALEVLDIFALQGRPLRFSDVQALSDQPKATLYRFLQTLTGQGMLSYDSDRGTYALGLRLVKLAHAAWKQSSLAPIARPHLDALAAEVGETVHLAQMDGGQVLYVDKRNASEPLEMFSQAGKVGPGYCTGVGKAIMAYLDPPEQDRALSRQAYHRYMPNTIISAEALRAELAQIRAEGFAYDREEHEPGIICIAKPILAGTRVVGALSVTTSTERRDLASLDTFKPALTRTAETIGTEAATWQFPTERTLP